MEWLIPASPELGQQKWDPEFKIWVGYAGSTRPAGATMRRYLKTVTTTELTVPQTVLGPPHMSCGIKVSPVIINTKFKTTPKTQI